MSKKVKAHNDGQIHKLQILFEDFAVKITKFAGTAAAFCCAFSIILIWGVCGPIFDYSETWQMVINTTTTIVTFLMVFLIQHSQNKDSAAINVKLDEILASLDKADNYLIDSEDLSEEELEILKKYYKKTGKEINQKDKNNEKDDPKFDK